jgi:uncharacterized protein YjbI with pentapeptide repeats
MKVFAPELPESFTEDADLLDKQSLEERVEECSFSGESYAGANFKGLDVLRTKFTRCDFSECSMENAGFRDVVFEACDFSNCDFSKAGFQRVAFIGCKLMGADFVEASLRYARFTDCIGAYANFADGKLQDTVFEKCRLDRAAFSRVKLDAAFDHCDLTQVLFQQAALKDIDLRTCKLNGMQVTLPDLKGAIVTTMQAADLAVLLGLVVRDEDD